jgi:hypothetical protein
MCSSLNFGVKSCADGIIPVVSIIKSEISMESQVSYSLKKLKIFLLIYLILWVYLSYLCNTGTKHYAF